MNIICINNLLPSDFQSFFGGKAIVTAVTAQSSNYCLRVTAEGANQNAQRPFLNTEIILILYSITPYLFLKHSSFFRKTERFNVFDNICLVPVKCTFWSAGNRLCCGYCYLIVDIFP